MKGDFAEATRLCLGLLALIVVVIVLGLQVQNCGQLDVEPLGLDADVSTATTAR